MSSTERDLIDRIGRPLVVAVLVYLTTFALGVVLSVLGGSMHPLLALGLSTAIVCGGLAVYYVRRPNESFL